MPTFVILLSADVPIHAAVLCCGSEHPFHRVGEDALVALYRRLRCLPVALSSLLAAVKMLPKKLAQVELRKGI